MDTIKNYNIEPISTIPGVSQLLQIDYSCLLHSYGLGFVPSEYYWQVGEIKKTQGWIIHLSVILTQFHKLLELLLPNLAKSGIPFKIVKNTTTAIHLLEGKLGYINHAKLIGIYPDTDNDAAYLAKELLIQTKPFKGPAIPTDIRLGGIVYTRFGSFSPIWKKDQFGNKVKHYYDANKKLVPDPYSIPFFLPRGISWPFNSILRLENSQSKLLNNQYYPLSKLKSDVKGDVIKAIYFKHLWQIKYCIIKQGRHNMCVDIEGRDIRSKLKWQYELNKLLNEEIPTPKVLSLFIANDDAYLAMEYVNGISLTNWLKQLYNNRAYHDLSRSTRLLLFECAIKIVNIIGLLHQKGFVHRDITPENFLITKDGKLMLIDLELCWSIDFEKTGQPFKLGTTGFMSPEQEQTQRPTIKEDIFALGALLLVFFTNLLPTKFSIKDSSLLRKQLTALSIDEPICSLIVNCLQLNPLDRPSLSSMKIILESYQHIIKTEVNTVSELDLSKNSIPINTSKIIQLAINGLANPILLNPKGCWISRANKQENHIGNSQTEVSVYQGWQNGIGGPMWLIGRAKKAGFSVEEIKESYETNWRHIRTHFVNNVHTEMTSLYSGNVGLCMALAEAYENGLLIPDEEVIKFLWQCVRNSSFGLNLNNGVSGQGIALLRFGAWFNSKDVHSLLDIYVQNILKTQNKDGSWDLFLKANSKKQILIGLNSGVSGILWFLMAYFRRTQDPKTKEALLKSLRWLLKTAFTKKGEYIKQLADPNYTSDRWASGYGLPGIILCLTKAFEVFKDPIYKIVAEANLRHYLTRPVRLDFCLNTGISGLGEVFLDAFKAFGNTDWKKSADWIAHLLNSTFQRFDHTSGFWLPTDNAIITTDLSTGTSGIIHFLIRQQASTDFGHPLWPNALNN